MITQKWADNDKKKNPNNDEEVEYDNLQDEKLEVQARSKDNLVLKFDKHSEKFKEIFEKHSEPNELKRQNSNSEENEEPVPSTKLKNIGKIFDDIAYLTGTSMLTYMEYLEGVNQKKTSAKAKDEIVHYFWKRIHQQELQNLRRNKKNTSIYKSAANSKTSAFNANLKKNNKTPQESKHDSGDVENKHDAVNQKNHEQDSKEQAHENKSKHEGKQTFLFRNLL